MQNADWFVLDWNISCSASQHFHKGTLGVRTQMCFHTEFLKCHFKMAVIQQNGKLANTALSKTFYLCC